MARQTALQRTADASILQRNKRARENDDGDGDGSDTPRKRIKAASDLGGSERHIKLGANRGVFSEALSAIRELQQDEAALVAQVDALSISVAQDMASVSGLSAATEQAIHSLYEAFSRHSFQANVILHLAWSRSIDSTREAAAKSKYGKVGGKFLRNFQEVLAELSEAFHTMQTGDIITPDANKEHQENKKLGGAETAHYNLQHAGPGERQMGGRGSLSRLHKALHRLKSGGESYDYKSMLDEIRDIIREEQAKYEEPELEYSDGSDSDYDGEYSDDEDDAMGGAGITA